MIKNNLKDYNYYNQKICKDYCENYNSTTCSKNFESISDKKEKINILVCKNYKRKIEVKEN